jgi:hypothetical protein
MKPKPPKPPEPETPEEWQTVVDAAAGALVIADCMMYGLFEGPKVNVERCDDILKRGAARGVKPSKDPAVLAIELIAQSNASQEEVEPHA